MAHKPVGSGSSFSISGTSSQSSVISHQSDSLRVVTVGCPAHVAIGTNTTATSSNYYIRTDSESTISLGKPASQRVVGVITGTKTIIDFPEGTGSPFSVGDAVSLTILGSQSYLNFSHKIVDSVDTSSNVGGYYSTRITVNHDTSGILTAYNAPNSGTNYAELRGSFKVGAIAASSSGSLYIQQVQVSGVS